MGDLRVFRASGSIASLLESPPEVASEEEMEQIAEHFGVSSMVIGHQVRNQLVART